MTNKTRVIVLSLFCVLSIPQAAAASGFALFSQAARAAGMANAFVARASDPSAVWYNPAGLSKLDGFQIYVGGNLVSTGKRQYYSVYRDRTLTADSLSSILPNVFVSYKLTDRIGFGLGIYSPYNYEITWPQTAEVEHLVYSLKHMEIRSLAVSPAASVRLGKNFSLGAGVTFYSCRFAAQYHYPADTDVLVALLTNGEVLDTPDTLFDLKKYKSGGVSFFAGLQWDISPSVSFGTAYRRGRPLTFDSGTVNAWEPETPNAYASAKLAELFPDSPDQSAVISFTMVDQISAGLALKIGRTLELEFDLSWVLWSQMDSFTVDYAQDTFFRSFWSGYSSIDSSPNLRNTLTLQLGGEYSLSPAIDLRFGAFRSSTPITPSKLSPAFPFTDKLGFSLGLGYHTGRFNLDAAYVYTAHSEIEDINGGLIRWGDDSQKYLSRNAGCFIINTGIRF